MPRVSRRAWPWEIRHTPRRSLIGGRQDLDAGVGIVDPVHRHLAHTQPEPLGRDEELGVEEPLIVLDQGQDSQGGLSPQRLEATLGVTESTTQEQLEEEVVGARDELALRAHGSRGSRGPGGYP